MVSYIRRSSDLQRLSKEISPFLYLKFTLCKLRRLWSEKGKELMKLAVIIFLVSSFIGFISKWNIYLALLAAFIFSVILWAILFLL